MIELNKEIKWGISAKIKEKERTKIALKRGEAETLKETLKDFTDPETVLVLNYLLMERKVELDDGKILLFSEKRPQGKVGPSWIISGNPNLYELVAKLI